jgi:Tol biopolymer transport system component
MEGEREWKPLLHEEYTETNPRISPDGRWIAYVSNESEPPEIYVRPFPEVDNGKWQVSTGGAVGCLWSPDGRELFYFSSDLSSLMQVEVETKPTFKLGKSQAIFNLGDAGVSLASFMSAGFDVSPDGKRFLMLKQASTTLDEPTPARPGKIIVVTNWFEELKQRVPVH